MRIALANLRFPRSRDESVVLATNAVHGASAHGAEIVCFPECYVPGYRSATRMTSPASAAFLERAWSTIADAARDARIAVVLGTERLKGDALVATALVIDHNGARAGFQDKVQVDPSEEGTYTPGESRRVFHCGDLVFGVVICHEGWRYPETVRWAVRHGAHVVFHPHFHEAEQGSYKPTRFGDPSNSFHESALLCRAAENTCYIASVNYASEGSPTTSAVIKPDGTLQTYQPYGKEGLLFADIDPAQATGLLARRFKPPVAALRKQYYFRKTPEGLAAWDVDRLIALSAGLPRQRLPVADIREIDEAVFGEEETGSWRNMLQHVRLMDNADLQYPIILSARGDVMDGMHRVARAVYLGLGEIEAVRFAEDPPPDYLRKGPDELPYPES